MTLNANIQKITLSDQNKERTILTNLKFILNPGTIYTILGKNGSGKSTLIKSLTKLLDLNNYQIQGKVFWNDENIYNIPEHRLIEVRRNEIRYVLQNLTNNFDPLKKLKYYFDLSGYNNSNIYSILKDFLLPDFEKISNLHSYELSGGMAQRLSLLIALLPDPYLLILDEPTSAIDYTNINLIKIKLQEFIRSDRIVLIVTQDIDFAKVVSDKIAFLQNGRLSDFLDNKIFFSEHNSTYSNFLQSFNELK
jgi:ABC-type glutathione transport system ATPase component